MRYELFSVYDMAAEMYVEPFCAPTVQVALRGFQEACTTEGHQFRKFPEDYALYHVASYDGELGVMDSFEARRIAVASSYIHGDLEDLKLEQA